MKQIQMIAMRIRDLRETIGLSREDVASRAQVPLDEYIAYESGNKDFTFSNLFNIAQTLGVDISDLLTGESPKLHGYVLTRKSKGLIFDRNQQFHYQHLAYNFSHKLAEPFLVTMEMDRPGVVRQAHSHEGQEFDYVLEGALRIIIDGNDMLLREGDSIYYDSALPHVMHAPEENCVFIAVVMKNNTAE